MLRIQRDDEGLWIVEVDVELAHNSIQVSSEGGDHVLLSVRGKGNSQQQAMTHLQHELQDVQATFARALQRALDPNR
jgi:hypothetical protein